MENIDYVGIGGAPLDGEGGEGELEVPVVGVLFMLKSKVFDLVDEMVDVSLQFGDGVGAIYEGQVAMSQVVELVAVLKQPQQVAPGRVHQLQLFEDVRRGPIVEFGDRLREDDIEEDDDEHQHEDPAVLHRDSPSVFIIQPLHLLVVLVLEGVCDLAEEGFVLVPLVLVLCCFLDGLVDEYFEHGVALHVLGCLHPEEEVVAPACSVGADLADLHILPSVSGCLHLQAVIPEGALDQVIEFAAEELIHVHLPHFLLP